MRLFSLALILALILVFLTTFAVDAQASRDPGLTEPYHPALVTFRVGIYHLLQLHSDQAADEFTTVIEALPGYGSAFRSRAVSRLLAGQFREAWLDFLTGEEVMANYQLPYQGISYVRLIEFVISHNFKASS